MGQSAETSSDAERHSRLTEYLGALHPNTQQAVLRELELSELRGDVLGPSFKVVMNELRRGIRKSGRVVERIGNPSRIFYMPVQPFLIDEAPEQVVAATVSRLSLMPIWAWVCRDLIPAEAKTYVDTCKQALLADDRPSAVVLANVFQEKFVLAVTPLLAAKKNPALQRRLAAYGAPATAVGDLGALFYVMQNRDALRDIGKLFPSKMKEIDEATEAQVSAMLAALPPKDDVMLSHALAIVMSQLKPQWQIVRLAASRAQLREAILELVVGRAQAMAAALRTVKWSIDQTHDAAEKVRDVRAIFEIVKTELHPGEDAPEGRRLRQIQELIERFEGKIALTLAHMGNGVHENNRVPGGDMLPTPRGPEQKAFAP